MLRITAVLFVTSLVFFSPLDAQQSAPQDPTAVAILQQSFIAMGGTVPPDSVATGTVTITAGSKTNSGTIRLLTRSLSQTAEIITTETGEKRFVYSNGLAMVVDGGSRKTLSLEFTVSSQSSAFPLTLVANAVYGQDMLCAYEGSESLDGSQVHRLRIWQNFASNPKLAHLSEFSEKHLWLDAQTGIPRKLSVSLRAARGDAPPVPLVVSYSDYRNVGGILYPFLIEKSLNGVPWATTTVQSVSLNTGLSDQDFQITTRSGP